MTPRRIPDLLGLGRALLAPWLWVPQMPEPEPRQEAEAQRPRLRVAWCAERDGEDGR